MWQFEHFRDERIETVLLTTKLLVRAWFEVVRTARTNHCTGAVSMVRRATALGATTSTCTMHGTAVLKGLSELVSHIGLVSVRLGTTVRRCDQRRGPMDSQSYQRVHTTYYIAYIINPTSKMYVTTSPTHIPTRIHTVRPLHRRHSNHERTAIGTIERHNRRCATRDSCTPAQERMDCT